MDLKYYNLKEQYLELKTKYNELAVAYQQVLSINSSHLHRINQLEIENDILKSSHRSAPAPTLSPPHMTLCVPKKENLSASKTPQANPDQSVNIENETSLMETFLVVGVDSSRLSRESPQPEILWEYGDSDVLSQSVRSAIPDFWFPNGISKRKLKLTSSGSEVNSLIFGQAPSRRTEDCFTFTIRVENDAEVSQDHGDMPNSNKDLIYVLCLKVEDIVTTDVNWVVPKCYCVISYYPIFELHYNLSLIHI